MILASGCPIDADSPPGAETSFGSVSWVPPGYGRCEHICDRTIRDDWDERKALLAEAGITKDARLHDAGHTAGTLLGELHVDMHVIQRILSHAQVSTTRICTDPTGSREKP
jgi:integrase